MFNIVRYIVMNFTIKRCFILLLLPAFFFNTYSYSQSTNQDSLYRGFYLEVTTAGILSNTAKIYSDLDYIDNKYIDLALQPGAEFIYGLPGFEKPGYVGSPYYDINLLCSIHLLPNSEISLKPFIGPFYRITSDEISRTYFDIKYGTALQFNVSKSFSIIIKVMNTNTRGEEIIPVLMGIGCTIKIF